MLCSGRVPCYVFWVALRIVRRACVACAAYSVLCVVCGVCVCVCVCVVVCVACVCGVLSVS